MSATRPSILTMTAFVLAAAALFAAAAAPLVQTAVQVIAEALPTGVSQRPLGPCAGAKAKATRLLFLCINGVKLTSISHLCISAPVIYRLHTVFGKAHLTATRCSQPQHRD
jgi:hypothetical protein